MKKYIIFSRDDSGKPIIHYVYRVHSNKNITELTVFKEGHVEYVTQLNGVIKFNEKSPAETISKFKKLLLIQTD